MTISSVIAWRGALARSAAQTRSRSYAQASDAASAPLQATAKRRGVFWPVEGVARSVTMWNIAPSSLLPTGQDSPRHADVAIEHTP
jgi:hypothetical protein